MPSTTPTPRSRKDDARCCLSFRIHIEGQVECGIGDRIGDRRKLLDLFQCLLRRVVYFFKNFLILALRIRLQVPASVSRSAHQRSQHDTHRFQNVEQVSPYTKNERGVEDGSFVAGGDTFVCLAAPGQDLDGIGKPQARVVVFASRARVKACVEDPPPVESSQCHCSCASTIDERYAPDGGREREPRTLPANLGEARGELAHELVRASIRPRIRHLHLPLYCHPSSAQTDRMSELHRHCI